MTEETETACPDCGCKIVFQDVAKFKATNRLEASLYPEPGQHLQATTVGNFLVHIAELMRASGDRVGIHSETIVDGVTCKDGGFKFDLIVVNASKTSEITP